MFKGHAAFAIENLAPLTTRIDQTKALRQTILNLAVCGKLVEQDRADEPASELLRRMDAARLEMLEAGYPNPSEAQTQLKKLSKTDRAGLRGKPTDRLELGNTSAMLDVSGGL